MCASYAITPYANHFKNIKQENCGLIRHSNVGSVNLDSTGDQGAIKGMWLNNGGMATIILLKQLKKLQQVTYDSRCHGGAFIIHTNNGNIVVKNNSKGMPYLYLRELEAEAALSFVQTMQGNMEGFTKHKVQEACAAC
jgi:hypothetical protein